MAITSAPAPGAKAAAQPKTLKSAKPGTADKAGANKAGANKKEKVKKVEYPGLFDTTQPADGDGNHPRVTLSSIPDDYNPKLHKPLKKSDFTDESVFLIARAERLEKMAAKLRKEAETVKNLGSTAQRNSARKLLKMQESMAALMKQLAEQGVDVQSLMATTQSAPAASASDDTSGDE